MEFLTSNDFMALENVQSGINDTASFAFEYYVSNSCSSCYGGCCDGCVGDCTGMCIDSCVGDCIGTCQYGCIGGLMDNWGNFANEE